jgi:hypothetical protein
MRINIIHKTKTCLHSFSYFALVTLQGFQLFRLCTCVYGMQFLELSTFQNRLVSSQCGFMGGMACGIVGIATSFSGNFPWFEEGWE